MRVLWQGIRAATIETLGIVLVIGVLFGVPSWALTGDNRLLPEKERVAAWFETFYDSVRNHTSLAQSDAEARKEYAEQRLSHYSLLFRKAASGYAKQATSEITAGLRG